MEAANDNSLPRSRAEAKAVNSSKYFTGKPCKHGHIDVRNTKYGTCYSCSRERTRSFNERNPEKKKEWDRRYGENNREKIAENMRRWVEKNPDGRKRWREANPDYDREWKLKNPDKVKAKAHRAYDKKRDDPRAKLEASIRAGVRKGIVRGSKSARKTFSLLGYSVDELMAHLEGLFQNGMSWDNYGDWHIDHKIPIAAHNYTTPDDFDFKRCWALANLQPLWAADNIRKHARLDAPFQPSFALST